MKRYFVFLFCLIVVIMLGAGCKKFLDVNPSTNAQVSPRSAKDFEQILNNSALATPNYLVADLMGDDIMLGDALATLDPSAYNTKAYNWDATVWGAADVDFMYDNSYRMILQMNIVVDNIDKADSGTVQRKNIIRAQAKINRAYYYFQLVNLYGNGYQAATAGTDLGVPLVLHAGASMETKRTTVQTVYDQILLDLQDAVNNTDLPDFGVDVIHPGRAAALAMQARAYLYMGNYEKALAAATLALNIKSTLLDYNKFSFVSSYYPSYGINNKPFTLKDQVNNPEVLFARVCTEIAFKNKYSTSPWISDDLAALFGPSDLRFIFNFPPNDYGQDVSRLKYFLYNNRSTMMFDYNIGVPEMMLIKAECLARQANADVAGALTLLNQLRKYRFTPAKYVPLTGTDATAVLKLVLDERRRELFQHGGIRIFDLKRLNTDSRFKVDLTRVSDVSGKVIATLPAGSPRYLVPFAPMIIANNPSIIQNNR
ncbi:RagB/SusD family nutrient uptake outer membrane protein [Pedobacter nutrimenti]|uniref:RagB/SusD family nutrient uptake outer membrane protein n=1 Tax=Pedobacter nutrimenti TaxID=1241337 RepID=UPI00292ED286|nr:RagB/SusD family nutrient uptake outer membrane protein [Pedobacter nutrimenti]